MLDILRGYLVRLAEFGGKGDSSPVQGQAFGVSILRIREVFLAEFGGKGKR